MQQNKITEINKLPHWFDLKKYEHAVRYKAEEWSIELTTRYYLYSFKKDGIWPHYNEVWQRIESYALISEYIRQNPLPDETPCIESYIPHFKTVSSLSNLEMYQILLNPNREEIERKLEVLFYNQKASKTKWKKTKHWSEQNFNEPQDKEAYISVNLSGSNEQIIADFKTWLEENRSQQNENTPIKNFTPADFLDWYELGILPYLDLTLWSQLTGNKISQYFIAKILFEDNYEVDPVGRLKTTKKKAAYLLQRNVIEALSVQNK